MAIKINKNIVIEDTNVALKDLVPTDSGWQQLNAEIRYRKINGIVYVWATSTGTKVIGGGDYTVVGQLPVGYRPADTFMFAFSGFGGQMDGQSAQALGNGVIQLYYPAGVALGFWGFYISFPADN